jgi:hypothetical protein
VDPERLSEAELQALSDGQLLERTAALVAARNRLDAELARTVRTAELRQAAEHDGLKTMRSWLRTHTRLSAAAAGQLVRTGRALTHLPVLAAACAAGTVTADQLALAAPITTPGRLAAAAAQGVDLAAIDATLTGVASSQPHTHLAEAVQHYLNHLDPDGIEPDPTEGRSLTIATHTDGSISLRGELDAVGGQKLQTALEALAAAGRCAGDLRTRAQTLGDALVQLCDNSLAAGILPTLRTVKPHVVVRIDLDDLADPGTGPGAARTGFGPAISAARARWLGCDGGITRIVFGPDGVPLDLGREQRVVSAHLRKAVENRDRGCVFTGCGAPTYWCDVHHLLEWINGGETTLANSALLCERHHTKVHHGFRVQRQHDGRWRTWRPDGTEILIPPERTAA